MLLLEIKLLYNFQQSTSTLRIKRIINYLTKIKSNKTYVQQKTNKFFFCILVTFR